MQIVASTELVETQPVDKNYLPYKYMTIDKSDIFITIKKTLFVVPLYSNNIVTI